MHVPNVIVTAIILFLQQTQTQTLQVCIFVCMKVCYLEDGINGVLARGEVDGADVIGVGHMVGLRIQQLGDE